MAKAPRFKSYTKRQLWFYTRRALLVLFSWTFIAMVLFYFEYYTLISYRALTSDYDFKQAFISHLIMAVSAGLIGGFVTVNLMERWLRKYAFWKALLFITITYVIAALLVSSIVGLYYYSQELGLPLTHPAVLDEFDGFFKQWIFIKNFIIWLVIVVTTLIVFMINDKYGPGVFPDYLMGRYFHPKNERRIFMFADIKDATTIAEKLGEEKYFNFLKDFFRDIAPAIVQTQGEVYQYVGDEVVISWKMKNGLKQANTLQCYYSMQKIIKYKSPRYIKRYGVAPSFKAGIHFGPVMVGEVGQIKREIVFSGDVLNTAARIAASCNDLGVEILASKDFANISKMLPKNVKVFDMGKESLKGKAEDIALVTYKKEKS
ncbi:putative adenylate/guanylate cyclase [unidentified eubacterium SCB49]|nr:putative adenylate/guanylate cyclase [unidentified eubacterium SCB49]